MDAYIDGRLQHWADSVRAGALEGRLMSNGATLAAMARNGCVVRGTARGGSVLMDAAAEDVERCVVRLPDVLRQAVMEQYLQPSTAEQKAKFCGCGVKAFYARLGRAHVLIRDFLTEN